MKARELLALMSVKSDRHTGRKVRVRTTDRRCKAWVAAHQSLLRRYVRDPQSEVPLSDVIDGAAVEDLGRLGFELVTDANDRVIWCHPAGDDDGIRALVGLVSEADIREQQQRAAREARGLARSQKWAA